MVVLRWSRGGEGKREREKNTVVVSTGNCHCNHRPLVVIVVKCVRGGGVVVLLVVVVPGGRRGGAGKAVGERAEQVHLASVFRPHSQPPPLPPDWPAGR